MKIKAKLVAAFEMVDISLISFYLELKIERDHQKQLIKLFQSTYIKKILEKYHLYFAKPCNILMKERILLPNEVLEAS